eukprot:2586482-Pyramimonas_sp.AAC.1
MGPEEIQQKCDEMLGQQPEGQYSDIALGCRAHILRAAATCLMDQVEKEEYDETLMKIEPVVEVPMSQVPGVLALLQVRASPFRYLHVAVSLRCFCFTWYAQLYRGIDTNDSTSAARAMLDLELYV